MKIKAFYRHSQCEKISGMERLLYEENRHGVYQKVIELMCALLKRKLSHYDILQKISSYLEEQYKREWFLSNEQLSQIIRHDVERLHRFMKWLGSDVSVLEALYPFNMKVDVETPDRSGYLEHKVHLITQDRNKVSALLIHSGISKRSMKGRGIHTSAYTDLYAMAAKYCLEQMYPEIVVTSIYLSHMEDTPDNLVPGFETTCKKSSNVHCIDYATYYEKGVFQYRIMKQEIEKVVTTPQDKICYGCMWENLCHTPAINIAQVTHDEETRKVRTYKMPTFTEDQQQVVFHKDGPMRVCAGPGSGKTASLTGRIHELIRNGVPAEFLLMLTFTNEAANEIRERCLSDLGEDSTPKVVTLNSLGYQILLENAEYVESGLVLLTQAMKRTLIKNLLSVSPTLTGFNYASENILYKSISAKLDALIASDSADGFFKKNPSIGKEFLPFCEQYMEILDAKGVMTFDQQITLCNKLFREHPEILKMYQNIYQYVMVDEFQDCSNVQIDMIYQIAAHRNIVVVGDDDQSIYGFRGASSKYMIDFPKHFPGARTIVLSRNFRSSPPLVHAAQGMIRKNKERLEKHIVPGREAAEGDRLPILVKGNSCEAIETIIDECRKEGYRFGDIGILSTRNQPLEDLYQKLRVPRTLAKSYLRMDALFLFFYTTLKLYQNLDDDKAFYQYACLFQKEKYLYKDDQSIYHCLISRENYPDVRNYAAYSNVSNREFFYMLNMLSDCFALLEMHTNIQNTLDTMAYKVHHEESASLAVIKELLMKQKVNSIDEVASFFSDLLDVEDDTRVEKNAGDRVMLITNHESKGKEYPVVIMRDDFIEESEEARRVYYVAMTRAKDRLYILRDEASKTNFYKEISHIEYSFHKTE